MTDADRSEVAELISVSTNQWYQQRGRSPVFPQGPSTTTVFAESCWLQDEDVDEAWEDA
jgi:hypothetical protein